MTQRKNKKIKKIIALALAIRISGRELPKTKPYPYYIDWQNQVRAEKKNVNTNAKDYSWMQIQHITNPLLSSN